MGPRVLNSIQAKAKRERDQPLVLFETQIKVPFHSTKKNNYRIAGKGFFKDQRTVWYEDIVLLSLRQRALDLRIDKPIDALMWAVFTYHFPTDVYFTRKNKMSQRLPDLSNLHESPQDCLQKAGIIKNDRLICSHDGSRRKVGTEYLLEIKLLRFDE